MSKARDIADLDFNSPDIDGGNIDGATIGASTAAAGSFTTGAFSSPVTITSDTESQFKVVSSASSGASIQLLSAGGYAYARMQNSNKEWRLGSYGGDQFVIRNQTDGTNDLILDGAGAVNLTGNLDVNGSQITVGTNNSRFAENNLKFLSGGAAYIDHGTTGQSVIFRVSNSSALDTTAFTISSNGNLSGGGNLTIGSLNTGGGVTAGDNLLVEKATTVNSTIRATGNNTRALGYYQAHTSAGADINMTLGVFGDASRGEISTATNHTLRLYVNNTPSKYLEIGTTGQVFTSHGMIVNEDSNDSDFRVESNGNTHMLFVDAGANHVNIGTSSDFGKALNVDGGLEVRGTGDTIELQQSATGSATYYAMDNTVETGGKRYRFGYTGGTADKGSWSVYNQTDNILNLVLSDDANVFNEDSKDVDFRVESDTRDKALFVDAGNDNVQILGNKFLEPVHAYYISSGTLNRNITVNLNNCGEYYLIMHIVGIWPYSGSNPGTRIIEVTGFSTSNVATVVRNTHYGMGPTGAVTVSATGNNLVVNIVTAQNYRWTAHCEMIHGPTSGMTMSVDGTNG